MKNTRSGIAQPAFFKKIEITICLCLVTALSLKGQYHDIVPQLKYGGRINSPINVEVKKNDDAYLFTASNKSLYEYEFELKFKELSNPGPTSRSYKTVLQPGNNRLFTLSVLDKQSAVNYQYTYSYKMGNNKKKADKGFPYLIPLAQGKTVEYISEETGNTKTILISYFNTNHGDTICAARRGFVTAIPEADIELDRIKTGSSLEIRHYDGTVAVYSGIDPSELIAKLGRVVYPGQPIGLCDNNIFHLSVYEFLGGGSIRNFNFLYANQLPEQLVTARDIKGKTVSYPVEVITKEMSKREVKKYKKGVLY